MTDGRGSAVDDRGLRVRSGLEKICSSQKGMEDMTIEGRVWKFGNDVDTDLILPARFLNLSDPAELAKGCFVNLRPDFIDGVTPGDIIVGGNNFGCGSSREHAPLALREAGVGAIVARGFARIFYRNAFNIGLPLLESAEAAADLAEGDRAAVDIVSGIIENKSRRKTFRANPIPPFMRELIGAGGLVEYIRMKKISGRK